MGRQDLVSVWPARYKMALEPGKAPFPPFRRLLTYVFNSDGNEGVHFAHSKFNLSEVIFKLR